MSVPRGRVQARLVSRPAGGTVVGPPCGVEGVVPVSDAGTTPEALRWPWSVRAADLARIDRFIADIADDRLRAEAVEALSEGLRRRYRVSQLACGFAPDGYRGLLGLLLDRIQDPLPPGFP